MPQLLIISSLGPPERIAEIGLVTVRVNVPLFMLQAVVEITGPVEFLLKCPVPDPVWPPPDTCHLLFTSLLVPWCSYLKYSVAAVRVIPRSLATLCRGSPAKKLYPLSIRCETLLFLEFTMSVMWFLKGVL